MLRNQNNHIDAARIKVEVMHHEHSLAKDIIETVTGISGSAFGAGGRITTETVVYSGQSTPNPTQQTLNQVFFIGSLTANVLDFLLVPCGYLYYKFWRKEPVPFNTENNLKWALAGLSLTLAIISTAARVASMPISFISGGVAFVSGGINIIRYFYDLHTAHQKLNACIAGIETLTRKIQNDLATLNEIDDYPENVLSLNQKSSLKNLWQKKLDQHSQKLQAMYFAKHHAERTYTQRKSPIELVDGIVKAAFAVVILIGTGLSTNPATIWIGMGLIAAVAVTNLIFVIVKKTIELIKKRRDLKNTVSERLEIEITPSSTHTIITAFALQPEITAHPAVKKKREPVIAERGNYSETVLLLPENEESKEDYEVHSDPECPSPKSPH